MCVLRVLWVIAHLLCLLSLNLLLSLLLLVDVSLLGSGARAGHLRVLLNLLWCWSLWLRRGLWLRYGLRQDKPPVDWHCRPDDEGASRIIRTCGGFGACQLNANVVREKIRQHDSDIKDVFGDSWVDLEDRMYDQRFQCDHQSSLMLV